MPQNKPAHLAHSSSLARLQPVDDAAFGRSMPGWVVWGSLLLVWMASLLPWRLWQPVPDLLLLFLVYWCLHEPSRVGLTTAFVFGLLMDVHDAGLLGLQSVGYVLAAYGVELLRRRLLRFPAIVQMLHILPVLVLATLVPHLLGAWLQGAWAGWAWLWSVLMTVALWPLLDILMSLPVRSSGAGDTGSV
ncbi:rod shape-determining protein MreD [Castellaniella sp.]|uniref:rod shape-determining protein MreD n=1 Tax=Castellaniella sp. TaxID=1955812 RepID=UPI0035651BA4